jgi:ribosomal protein S18 acetylase RimI-like enzyme
MHYRLYLPEDFPALYDLEELCFSPPQRFSRSLMRQLLQRKHSATWIAEDHGIMTGFAIVAWEKEDGELLAYIQTIEVTPSHRSRGIARTLLARAESSAQAAGATLIWLHVDEENLPAVSLYEARRYKCVGREEDFYAPGQAALLYAKALSPAKP